MKRFYYHGDTETLHPQLGLLTPGANDIADDLVALAEACVEAGLLSHASHQAPPKAARAPRQTHEALEPEEPKESQEPSA